MTQEQVFRNAQEFLRQEQLPGWLIHDYRHSNPIFWQVVTPSGHVTRPCFLYIPASGAPKLLTHHVDAGKFAETGLDLVVYSNRQTMVEGLRQVLSGVASVAMEYSPQNQLPRVSRVDAGTVELVRSLDVEVVSSADVMQYATQRWTPEQLQGHQRAAAKLGQIVNEAFQLIGARLRGASTPLSPPLTRGDGRGIRENFPTEYDIAEFIRRRYREEGLEAADGPIVSVNAHCSDPHYEPALQGSSVIQPGDWVLIDLWARESASPPARDDASYAPGVRITTVTSGLAGSAPSSSSSSKGEPEEGNTSVYADITWTAYVGEQVPQHHQEIFDIVVGARDAALKFLQDSFQRGESVQGWHADAVARQYIEERGYGKYFTHRLGHSISYEVHGEAVNLDNFETHDTRHIIPGIGFSIEPGIYLPEFGVRSEIDAYMSESGPYATSPVQREVVLIKPG
jgi:Xaa-Pro dipeptidase